MRKIVFIFLIGIAIPFYILKGQCDIRMYDIFTPAGNPVVTFLMCESSNSTRDYYDTEYAKKYPNARQITTYDGYSSTRKFNCHGYAWLRVEQGIDRWIGTDFDNDITDPEKIYMTDHSYTKVLQESYPGKVSWSSGDHSAITTPRKGIFISKWGELPLMEHAWNYSPYGSDGLEYYSKPILIGPDLLSETTTYTIFAAPTVAYTLQISPNLTLVSSDNNSVKVTPTANGSAYINLLINGSNIVAQKIFTVGPPIISGITYDGYALNAQFYGSSTSVIKTEWTIDYGMYSSAGTWIYPPVNTGTHTISVRAYNNLGWGSPFTTDFTFPGSSMYSINVNARNVSVAPASTQLTGSNSRADASSVNNALSYSVIDLTTGVVAVTGKLPAAGGAVDLSNLPSGIYVFRLDDGMGNVQSTKIILK